MLRVTRWPTTDRHDAQARIHMYRHQLLNIMKDEILTDKEKRDRNADPITGEPGAHPVATGIGSAGGGVAGAAIGTTVGGPVGTVVGGVIGAIAGGYAGKAAGEVIDPTVEDTYWRENHAKQPYASGSRFDDYQPAYRTGYEGYSRHGAERRSFDEVEIAMQNDYMATGSKLPWERARDASRAAWNRVHERRAAMVPRS
jgi:hypothetical protein